MRKILLEANGERSITPLKVVMGLHREKEKVKKI